MRVTRRLKDATADHHARAERHVRILDPDATVATYRRFLERMYGFHHAVELVFAEHPGLAEAGFEAHLRRKGPWIAEDLGADVADLPLYPAARLGCEDVARAIGVAYVLEGSTLGGRFILARMGPELRRAGTRYLDGYRAETGPRWKRFCAVADAVVGDEPSVSRAIAGARDTFGELVGWLDEPERDPPHPYLTAPGALRR